MTTFESFIFSAYEMVREFYKGQRIEASLPTAYTPFPPEQQRLRDALFLEELREYISSESIVEKYDALCDMAYIGMGTLIESGYKKGDILIECRNDTVLFRNNIFPFIIKPNPSNYTTMLHHWKYETFVCFVECFAEVHRSNMTKRLPDGTYIYNEYGKIIKPTSENNIFGHCYEPPQLAPIIKKYFPNE